MQEGRLLEPGDKIMLEVVRAERVLPGDIYWGTETDPGNPRKGFVLESEGSTAVQGAQPSPSSSMVIVASRAVLREALVLVQTSRLGRPS